MRRELKEELILEKYLESFYYSDDTENSVEYIMREYCPSNFEMNDKVDEMSKCKSEKYCENCWMVSAYRGVVDAEEEKRELLKRS